jgi:transcription elongation factor Elf1
MPELRCGVCGDEATAVCSIHAYDREGWLCDNCQADHECGPEALLPAVDSPRVGMCAYTG